LSSLVWLWGCVCCLSCFPQFSPPPPPNQQLRNGGGNCITYFQSLHHCALLNAYVLSSITFLTRKDSYQEGSGICVSHQLHPGGLSLSSDFRLSSLVSLLSSLQCLLPFLSFPGSGLDNTPPDRFSIREPEPQSECPVSHFSVCTYFINYMVGAAHGTMRKEGYRSRTE